VRAGALRTLIRIERPVAGANPYGDSTATSWELVVATYAEKRVSVGSGRESERFEQRLSTYDTEWSLRYRTPADPRWRFVEVVTGTIHDVVFMADPDGRRRELVARTRIAEPQPDSLAVP
jgi:head-tail adaptor